MNVQAHARASAVQAQLQQAPLLKASDLLGSDAAVGALLFFARLPEKAPVIVAQLEQAARFKRLDRTLNQALRIARSTLARSSRRTH